MNKRGLGRWAVYLVLFFGAIVFSLPFVWMIGTSVKVDQELFTKDLRLLPQQALPRERSPYWEHRRLEPLPGTPALQQAILPAIEALVTERLPSVPPDGVRPIAEAAYASLESRATASTWSGPTADLLTFARSELTAGKLAELAANVHRELLLGAVRVRSRDLEDSELLRSTPAVERWTNQSPDTVTLTGGNEGATAFNRVSYNFARQDRFSLSMAAKLPFSGDQLERLQLRFQPDDTWHEVDAEVEVAGVRYRAERPVVLGGNEWTTLTLQFPSTDDRSTKIKTWLLLQNLGPSAVTGDQISLRLTVRQVSVTGAGFNKVVANYQRVLDQVPLGRYLRVSLFLVVANIVLTVLASSLVAYSFARLTWPGREFCFLLLLATMMIPGQVTMIPHFLIWKSLGAYNTLTPLFAGAALGNAFFIFLLRQFMKGIPRDLEDAARIDGCGFIRIYWHVILPLVKPSLAAIAIFTFMGTWNDFMGPLLFVADQRLYSLAFGLYAFSVQVNGSPTLTMAASLLMTIPVILLFFAAQRYFIQGVTLTGMKG